MKKYFFLLLFIPLILSSQIDDTDKHFVAGVVISTSVTLIVMQTKAKHPPIFGLLAGTLIGLGKEVIDHRKHGIRFKNENNAQYYDHISDVMHTISGSMTATITMFVIIKHRERKKEDRYMLPQ